ncbi:PIG-L family deacetylase [Streptacidiphilus jiangxiensis]|uniref:N-acetyl-1-D-myo-inositol-2-amino-2-deoxy-alpha-D-glucopyranoside deacetylase n=1 Tax=Streptacidiphilus jiangxiensis TaxID=235985 RepID=A0A1H7HXA5_STRJI|nr:PIG-L family deacetylase [Streptacidiphilus jiangxiensis]SEK54267.1 N-acetyl-1-D-myo-inositol-2-amino-2-deoxy-alpha-D-glucopyranoside deacetylase [Streptacidiphilus jiangxiensis]
MLEPRHDLLAVHAHPDDESLWTGGLLAREAAAGRVTAVVTCTDGELADGGSAAAPGTRTKEWTRALRLLGVASKVMLPYRDSGRDGTGPGSLCAAPFDEVVAHLVEQIRALRPSVVVTYDPAGASGHIDHIRVHRATLAAVEAAAVPFLQPGSGPAWAVSTVLLVTVPESLARLAADAGLHPKDAPSTPDDRIAATVDVRPWLDTKWAALRCHASEFERGASVAVFADPGLREIGLGAEYYLHRTGPGASLGPEPDEA